MHFFCMMKLIISFYIDEIEKIKMKHDKQRFVYQCFINFFIKDMKQNIRVRNEFDQFDLMSQCDTKLQIAKCARFKVA
jgi:hypothetical protein